MPLGYRRGTPPVGALIPVAGGAFGRHAQRGPLRVVDDGPRALTDEERTTLDDLAAIVTG